MLSLYESTGLRKPRLELSRHIHHGRSLLIWKLGVVRHLKLLLRLRNHLVEPLLLHHTDLLRWLLLESIIGITSLEVVTKTHRIILVHLSLRLISDILLIERVLVHGEALRLLILVMWVMHGMRLVVTVVPWIMTLNTECYSVRAMSIILERFVLYFRFMRSEFLECLSLLHLFSNWTRWSLTVRMESDDWRVEGIVMSWGAYGFSCHVILTKIVVVLRVIASEIWIFLVESWKVGVFILVWTSASTSLHVHLFFDSSYWIRVLWN